MKVSSWHKALGVSWEKGSLSNVVEIAVKFNDALKSETSASMCGCTILESVDVVLDCLHWDAHFGCTLSKEDWVMDALGS